MGEKDRQELQEKRNPSQRHHAQGLMFAVTELSGVTRIYWGKTLLHVTFGSRFKCSWL